MNRAPRSFSGAIRARYRRLPLRRKLIVLIGSVGLAVATLSVGASFIIELGLFRARLLEEYKATARLMASNLEAAVVFRDTQDSQEILQLLSQREFVRTGVVYLEDGEILVTYRHPDASDTEPLPPRDATSSLSRNRIVVQEAVVVDGLTQGQVVITATAGELRSFLRARTLVFIALLAFACIFSIVMASRLGRIISQPILDLAATAQRITRDHDFTTRHQAQTEDESGRLVEAFNEMIAEIGRREERILEAKERAEASSRAKDDFLSIISHELRTPLNPIIGYVEVLLRKHQQGEDGKQLGLIKHAAEHLQGLIDDVLDYSRIERGVFSIVRDPVDYRELCQNVVELMRSAAQAKGLNLDIEDQSPESATGQMSHILTDRIRLKQVLLNLVSNSIKFTDAGYVRIRAGVVPGSPDLLKVEVEDSGIGIAPEERGKVFEPFSQIDESLTRQHSGLGLGLAISRKIVEAMEGRIDFESEKAIGSRFWFEIPTELVAPPPIAEINPEMAAPLASGRVLLVDDQLVNRELAESLLQSRGLDVVCAKNGLEAIEKAKEESFSLVIMDIKMPGMNGYDAARAMRQMESGGAKRTPIIAMTAHVTTRGSQECYESGMDDFLAKPFNTEKLEIILRKWLMR